MRGNANSWTVGCNYEQEQKLAGDVSCTCMLIFIKYYRIYKRPIGCKIDILEIYLTQKSRT